MAKADKGNKGLARRVANLEREVRAITREAPERPEDKLARETMQGPVDAALARLQGVSRADLMSDRERGPVSGLGYGTGAQ